MNKLDKSKKLKQQYHQSDIPTTTCFGFNVYRFYKRKNRYYREFSTNQEKSMYYLHLIEYRDIKLRIRAKRGALLPTSWDDLPTGMYDVEKSWKHNSHRNHQWYRINDI
jgi:hypothetical protein